MTTRLMRRVGCALALTCLAAVTVAPASTSAATTGLPAFTSSVQRIDDALKARMVYSWRKGCPVARTDLRYLRVTYERFGGTARQGELVVHEDHAADVVDVFERLYAQRFPIRRMRLVDDYRGSDAASMAANNTSAFNCRRVTSGTSWSEHSYGRAVDINPVRNPYVYRGTVEPPAGEKYVDRSPLRKGMVTRAVRRAFASIGWSWGGAWTTRKDYQHFSSTGR
ncbi:MAG: M15 family metallopeptidase [Actinomycetes bacterium]